MHACCLPGKTSFSISALAEFCGCATICATTRRCEELSHDCILQTAIRIGVRSAAPCSLWLLPLSLSLASGRAHKQPRAGGNSGIPLSVQIGSQNVLIPSLLMEKGGWFVIPLTVGQRINCSLFWVSRDVLPLSVEPCNEHSLHNEHSIIPCVQSCKVSTYCKVYLRDKLQTMARAATFSDGPQTTFYQIDWLGSCLGLQGRVSRED